MRSWCVVSPQAEAFIAQWQPALAGEGLTLISLDCPDALWPAQSQLYLPEALLVSSSALLALAPTVLEGLAVLHPQLANLPLVALFWLDPPADLTPSQWQQAMALGITDWLNLPLEGLATNALVLSHLQRFAHQQLQLKQNQDLAQQLTEMNTQLYERNLLVEKELYTTRQLQQNLLPQGHIPLSLTPEQEALAAELPFRLQRTHYSSPRIKISGIYMPCDALGGDLYDIIPLHDGSLGLTVADVSGHGVPAGFITALFKSSLYRLTHAHQQPNQVLYHLNNELAEMVTSGDYVTTVYARWLEATQTLELSGAGHPYPVYYNAQKNTIERIGENGTPLVWIPDMDYPMTEHVFAAGDKLLLFTDGISELYNPTGDMLGEEALEAMFLRLSQSGHPLLLDALMAELSDFTQGHPIADDMSMMLLEIT